MSHDHDHDHAHDHAGHSHGAHEHVHGHGGHAHAPKNFGPAFVIGIGLNIAFVVIEAVFGWLGNSVALLADAGHNLSDVLGLVIAFVATLLAARLPSARFTYGLRGSSILAALFNGVLLLVAVGGIGWEAVIRLMHPEPAASLTVIAVAAAGIVVNGATAWLFVSGSKGDINVRGAFLHMAADAGVSAAVVVAGLLMLMTGWLWLDPVASLLVCAVIVWTTWSLLRDALAMSVDAVPAGIDPVAVRTYLCTLPGVDTLHDLHIWPMSTTEVALTAHLVMSRGHPGDAFLHDVAETLKHRFNIAHPTLQIEVDPHNACELAPDEVV
jgi:cobalt-zinc-cadmium efflux system protein